MKVPLLDLHAHHTPLKQQLLNAITAVLEGGQFILGPEVSRLEERIAAYSGTRFAIGVSSGTDALLAALMALGIGPGDDVITTPYSFFATAGVIARLGARPVFVDIDPATCNIDPARVKAAITERTRAVMPVHLYGQCADMGPMLALAEDRGISIVEDAAQAIGAQYRDGRRAGSMGQIGCFSFFPSKNLGALGDAGMIVTNDSELAEQVRILRAHGARPKYCHKVIGGNFRLDALQAAVLNVKLNHLDKWSKLRQQNADLYRELLSHDGFAERAGIRLPRAIYDSARLPFHHVYNQFVIVVEDRDGLRRYLNQNGVDTEIYYPVPFHLQACFRSLGYEAGDFPYAESAAEHTLALPIYPELTREMQEYVVLAIRAYYAQPN